MCERRIVNITTRNNLKAKSSRLDLTRLNRFFVAWKFLQKSCEFSKKKILVRKHKLFKQNFFGDWKKYLKKGGFNQIVSLDMCDFSLIYAHVLKMKEEKKIFIQKLLWAATLA